MTETPRRRVAIACQGGGSHTAFTAGVLSRLFSEDVLESFEIVGLSGTSGGAICALVAWSTLVSEHPLEAGALLERFWSANSAAQPAERTMNAMMLWGSRIAEVLPTPPAISPYDSWLSAWSLEHLRTLLRSVITFDELEELAREPGAPALLLGAVEVVSGRFRTFDSRRNEIEVDAVLASAAIPNLFRAVHVRDGAYWDGLFSQNPPVRDLLEVSPDEIWVIQVNPTEIDAEPTTIAEITNRRNELAGNLSLLQELSTIEFFDDLILHGELKSDRVRAVTVRLLEMRRPPGSFRWGYASKLNRDPTFIRELIDLGKLQAGEFLNAMEFERSWRVRDADQVMQHFAAGATVAAEVPNAAVERTSDPEQVRRFIADLLVRLTRIDLARKRVCRDTVAWEVRFPETPGHHRGIAEATFRDGLIIDFRLTATGV